MEGQDRCIYRGLLVLLRLSEGQSRGLEWTADDKPGPGDALAHVDAFHVLPVGLTGLGEAARVAVIGADDLVWIGQIGCQKVFGGEFEVGGRVEDITEWMDSFNVPVPGMIDIPNQYATGLDAPPLEDIEKKSLLRAGADVDARICF